MTRAGMIGVVATGVLGWLVMAASSLRSLDVTGGASSQAQERTYRGVQLRSNFRVLQQVQHDANAFTQGLFLHKDVLYEGTGLQGYSSVRKVDPQTGSVLSQTRLSSTYFGEGITLVGDKIVQLTWKHRKAFVYKADDLSQVGSFDYNTVTGEGWGATTSDKEIIVSDGSEWLVFWDKETYRETRRVRVVDGTGQPVEDLNELEYVEGYVFANIWMANNIAQIDPATGKVVAFYDFSSLFPADRRMSMDDVLNGIAYDHQRKILWLTGKRWPMYYKVELCGVPELNMQAVTCSDSGQ